MATEPVRVLVVDDDPDVAEFLQACFASHGCDVRHAATGDDALSEAAEFAPHFVFLDIIIPEQDGWLVCSKLKLQPNSPTIVLITGRSDASDRKFANFVHADAFLRKPFHADDALQLMRTLRADRGAAV